MGKGKLKAMSPAETEILRLVWQRDGATVQQILEALPRERKVTYKTVQTLLRRLEEKGYLTHKTEGKRTVLDFIDRLIRRRPAAPDAILG